MPTTTPEPAKIQVFDPINPTKEVYSIPCMFRPTQLKLVKSAEWAAATPTENTNVTLPTFSGGKAATLDLDLFFDTTSKSTDVRIHTNKLMKLTLKYKGKQPPLCRFVWGKITSFIAYVPSVTVTLTMFLGNGTPVRAEATLVLNQYQDDDIFKPQNPTSRSEARKTWLVVEGQKLDWIAYEEYGNARHWRHISEVNGLANPLDLRPGQLLKLTPLPPEEAPE